ncbi:hypothetical protein HanXRQr2_Chr12g0561851 [Helianthus annuus]|uniref:Uncharacterized protein n=1 Tax=Helianthus annuus TaxID=4232 RepID=A0A9K3MY98_HELAN|nr:hypothetical protein HanXRQr2_Chr12g0561851 [Helianthus annuus]
MRHFFYFIENENQSICKKLKPKSNARNQILCIAKNIYKCSSSFEQIDSIQVV